MIRLKFLELLSSSVENHDAKKDQMGNLECKQNLFLLLWHGMAHKSFWGLITDTIRVINST
jgi:hypothetical protein